MRLWETWLSEASAHGRGGWTGWSVRSPPSQTVLWCRGSIFFCFPNWLLSDCPEHRDISLHYHGPKQSLQHLRGHHTQSKSVTAHHSHWARPSIPFSTSIMRKIHQQTSPDHTSSLSHVSCKHRARGRPGCPSQALLSHLSVKEPPPDGPSTLVSFL